MKRNPTQFLREEYQKLVEQGLDWRLRVLASPSETYSMVDGKKVLILCSNNYLGLANHPKLKEAAIEATRSRGVGSGSVRAIAGNMDLHERLEKKIAEFKKSEAALYYQTGFAANAGLIPQLVEEGDVVVSDELNHGSIIDGVRLSKADRAIYKHCDTDSLAEVLEKAEEKNYRRILIITDGVFSMDGDIAPVDGIVELAKKHGAMTYVDDAHGDGVLGDGGRGIASHFNIEGKIDIEMGTFSKAFGVVGGYVTGSKDLVNFALNRSRTWLLSGSSPPPVVAACITALEVVESEPTLVETLWSNTRYFRKELENLGFDVGTSQTPIVPVIVGESEVARNLSAKLFEEGVFALPIVYPMVAQGKARVRNLMSAAFTVDDVNFALEAYEKAGRELHVI